MGRDSITREQSGVGQRCPKVEADPRDGMQAIWLSMPDPKQKEKLTTGHSRGNFNYFLVQTQAIHCPSLVT